MPLRYALLLLFFGLYAVKSDAQSYSVRGSVGDTLSGVRLHRASVVLISAKDSVLSTFTRSDSAGSFVLQVKNAGDYIVLVNYPGYAGYVDRIAVDKDINLSQINLASRTHVLQEFVLKKRASAIVIKGDTTEYTADSFALRSGASVEDLLKKLPGLQVDKDGKVTAQGETVQKILVDGEEFFSDDPAVVTKNLQAATVDKVQVYDKKSDQAAFTGIDDGEKTKTINLTLKEDKKRGFFGKAVAGGGPSLSPDLKTGFFENQAMVNFFRGKQQISGFGIMSNTGTSGLSWNDRQKYSGSGASTEYDDESGMMYSFYDDGDDMSGGWNGRYGGEGLPTVWTGGLHYANKWAKDAQHTTANYRFSKNNNEVEGSSTTQYILPDSQYVRSQKRNAFNTSRRHGGDGLYEWTIDTNSNVKLSVNGNYSESGMNSSYFTETRGASGGLINTSSRFSSNLTTAQSLNASLIYRKKFAKKGRNLSVEVRTNNRSSDGNGVLRSGNAYFQDGVVSGDSINQRKTNAANNFSINGNVSYTEPLSKKSFLTLRYGIRASNSLSERFSFNRAGSEWATTPDSLFSSSFGYDMLTQNGAATLRFVFKKYNFAFGGEAFKTSWRQTDRLYHFNDRTRDFNNFSPTASLRYNFNKQSNISLNYSGRTSQPTIDQLQPLRQNADPLNVFIGNPNLRQEFSNSVNFNYHSYKPLSGVYAYAGGGGSFVQNDIVRTEAFDTLGRNTYQYINVNGNYNFYIWSGYGFKIKGPGLGVRINANVNRNHNNTFVNGQRNEANNTSIGLSFEIDKDWMKGDKEVAGFSIEPGVDYYDNRATISRFANSYWLSDIRVDAYAELPWKLQVRTEAWANFRQKTEVFTANNNVIRWNASLGRKFLKGDKLEVRATVSDILNQNLGYRRDAQANYITEDRYNTIRRHALFSLVYLFSGGAGSVTNDDED